MKIHCSLLLLFSLSLSANSKSVSERLVIPEEITQNDFNIMYSKIPSEEVGELFLVEYRSENKVLYKSAYKEPTGSNEYEYGSGSFNII